jgi:hypothetical protein
VLAGNLELTSLLGDLFEQASVIQSYRRLIGEGLHETHNGVREFPRLAALQHQGTKRLLTSE